LETLIVGGALCVLLLVALIFPPVGMILFLLVSLAAEYWWVFVPGGIFWFTFLSHGCHHRDY
jgi:TRAP-type C4-dicarboxylate transport system permease large subunit